MSTLKPLVTMETHQWNLSHNMQLQNNKIRTISKTFPFFQHKHIALQYNGYTDHMVHSSLPKDTS